MWYYPEETRTGTNEPHAKSDDRATASLVAVAQRRFGKSLEDLNKSEYSTVYRLACDYVETVPAKRTVAQRRDTNLRYWSTSTNNSTVRSFSQPPTRAEVEVNLELDAPEDECFSAVRAEAKEVAKAFATNTNPATVGELAQGLRIEVWWPEDSSFYAGYVGPFRGRSGTHQILYDDARAEYIDLKTHRCRWPDLSGAPTYGNV